MDTRIHLDRSRTGQRKHRIYNGSSFLNPNVISPLSGGDYFNNITTVISPTSASAMDDDYGCTNIQI